MSGDANDSVGPLIAEAAAIVEGATAEWRAASDVTNAARSEETRALNLLNEAQKAFDVVLEDLRRRAPRESDWKQRERRGVEVRP